MNPQDEDVIVEDKEDKSTYSTDAELLSSIQKDKRTAYDYQKRKHPDWDENYLLYRNKVITNRLTQRQSINVPIMAETISSWQAKVDEPPLPEFVPLDSKNNNEKRKAIYWNAIMNQYYDTMKLELLADAEVKVVGLQGRAFKKLAWTGDELKCYVVNPFDVDLDPNTDPFDIETAMYIYHKNIFVPLGDVLSNEDYDKDARESLKAFMNGGEGKIQMAMEQESRQSSENRSQYMGVDNQDELAGSNILIELNEGFKKIYNKESGKYVFHYLVIGANNTILINKPMLEAIGMKKLPWIMVSDDPDADDLWNESKADRVRPMNKVMNTWLSQMIENRSYRNFSMFFYDSTNPDYNPTTFKPEPFGMYPVAGEPSKNLMAMPVSPLTDSLTEMNYFRSMIEGVTSITPTEKGVAKQDGDRTLGEIQIDLRESSKRIVACRKYFKASWAEFYEKAQLMLEANRTKVYDLYQEGTDGEMYNRQVMPEDLVFAKGYKIKIKMKADVDEKNTDEMKKLVFAKSVFQGNQVAQTKIKKQMLDILGFDPRDVDEIMNAEQNMPIMPTNGADRTAIDPNLQPQPKVMA